MGETTTPRLVKALYSFKGTNNDELCFTKGDLVTITQIVEGGWWEGTINGNTGWFPSNYVKEVKDPGSRAKSPTGRQQPSADLKMNKRESMLVYHNVVLQNLIDTERTYVNDLQGLMTAFLRPLGSTSVVSSSEHSRICGNLEDIMSLHQILLASLDECAKNPVPQQRIGGIFLKTAPQLKTMYQSYCSNHPSAVAVLQKNRDELCRFMEGQGAPTPGIMTLTTSLSKPFTRLEKYSNLLKELERHTEQESHVDRGDTQRAISVYRDISSQCMELRRQKEMEYEILNSPIKGWEGEDISQLGEVLLLSQVRVLSDNGEKAEQLFLLFPGVLVILSVSSKMSGYAYEGKVPVSGLSVSALDDPDSPTHSFEISGTMIDKRIVSCVTKEEQQRWIDTLQHQSKHGPTYTPSKVQPVQVAMSHAVMSNVTPAKTAQAAHHPYRPSQARTWTLSCLRPSPPLRPSQAFLKDEVTRSPRSGRKILGGSSRRKPVEDTKTLEDDALILRVIEAYCSSAKARQTVNSLDLTKIRLTQRELQNGNNSDTMPSLASSDPIDEETFDEDSDDFDDDDYVSLADLDLGSLDLDLGSLTQMRPRHSSQGRRQGQMLRSLCCISYPTAKILPKTLKRL